MYSTQRENERYDSKSQKCFDCHFVIDTFIQQELTVEIVIVVVVCLESLAISIHISLIR
jgi:hypothetical protein